MLKIFVLFLLLSANVRTSLGQVYMTRSGYASFFSSTPLEDIKAENKQLLAIVDLDKKQLAFTLLMRGFTFKKALMQSHFNENYVESDKYPKASFTGSFTGDPSPSPAKGNIKVMGNLTLHGVTKYIDVPATLLLQQNRLTGEASFNLNPKDFNIEIPGLVRKNIAEEILLTIKIDCTPK